MSETCSLLPGTFGILVQCSLFFTCVGVLVLKKLREHSDRTWSVFTLDSSKQVLGAGFVHLLNMLCATLLGARAEGDACDWYWMNIMVDTTLGVLLEYLFLMGLTRLLNRLLGEERARDFRFGVYSDDSGNVNKVVYAKQLGLWFSCIVGMKIVVLLILLMCLDSLYHLALIFLMLVSWNPQLKLVFVMLITPCCMNALQFWLTDSFIQKGGVSSTEFAQGCYGRCCGLFGKKERRVSISSHGVCLYDEEEAEGDFEEPLPTRRSSRLSSRSAIDEENQNGERSSVRSARSSISQDLNGARDSVRSTGERPSIRSVEQNGDRASARSSVRSHVSNLSEPLLADAPQQRSSVRSHGSSLAEAGVDPFEEERAAYQESIEHLRDQVSSLSTAAATERRERECAEVQAKMSEEHMLDAKEQLHRVQQELRLVTDSDQLLRDRLAVKEEREHQLLLRVQQLEFSYSTAGAASNAVFAAEVSAAAVAAASVSNSSRWRSGLQALQSGMPDCEAASTIDEFLTSSVKDEGLTGSAKAPSPRSSCAPSPAPARWEKPTSLVEGHSPELARWKQPTSLVEASPAAARWKQPTSLVEASHAPARWKQPTSLVEASARAHKPDSSEGEGRRAGHMSP